MVLTGFTEIVQQVLNRENDAKHIKRMLETEIVQQVLNRENDAKHIKRMLESVDSEGGTLRFFNP